jgi:AbrB family looped-hinge helix DNA binding protein
MTSAKVTSNGRITIPIKIRKELGIEPGGRVQFVKHQNGEIAIRAQHRSIMDLAGIVKWEGPPVTIEEMNETIRRGWAGELKEED